MPTCLDRLQWWLREQHVRYSIHHPRHPLSAPDVAMELRALGAQAVTALIAQVDGRLVMLVVPAAEHVDCQRVAQLLKARVARMVSDAECARYFPDCEPGTLPPFGSLFDVPTYVDESLMRTRTLVFQAGTRRDTVKLATKDYLRLAAPVTLPITRPRAKLGGRYSREPTAPIRVGR